MHDIVEQERRLNDFDPADRRVALEELCANAHETREQSENINLHIHSFFSYNPKGWSPSRIAWEACKQGLYAVGLCDFDVLDGQEEFLLGCEQLGIRGIVNIETRTFVREMADKEITSPGEPGVSYAMGCGFARPIPDGTEEGIVLDNLRTTARDRNVALIQRINEKLEVIAIDYETDVLPLTPSGTATERHIMTAYIGQAAKKFTAPDELVSFWSETLQMGTEKAASLLANMPEMETVVRARLAKRGGFGYVTPSETSFPPRKDFFSWVRACGAVPMDGWLDGSSDGEADSKALLECSREDGAAVLNIIPDRNWNFSDPEVQAVRVAKLKEIVNIADAMDLPLHIGTEMNKLGQPTVDNLDGEYLRPFKEKFIHGARAMCGHSALLRYGGYSYVGPEAEADFGGNTKNKNEFFASVGALPPVTPALADAMKNMEDETTVSFIRDAAAKGTWPV